MMKPGECEFEPEALAAALQSRWPGRVDTSLRTHVSRCAICADVIAVAGAIESLREETSASVAVPDSGRVWWRAQLRARREAAEAAGRPITAAQTIAFACAMGLLGACFGAASTWFQSAFNSVVSSLAGIDFRAYLVSAAALLTEHAALVFAMSALLFLVPAAVYLVMSGE